MIDLPLRLRAAAHAGPARGWLLTGADAEGWLRSLCATEVPLDAVDLFVVPGAEGPVAALAIGLPDGAAPPRALALTRFGDALFVPADAELTPPVRAHELRDLAPWPAALLHPVFGFVAFTAADRCGVADLLAPPPVAPTAWDRADPGTRGAARLLAVALDRPIRVEELLTQGGGDIGADRGAELPPAPGERPLGAGSLLHRLAHRALDYVDRAPATASRRTWVDWIGSIARRVLGDELLERRARELDRLMRLLRDDPDQGLRFALPLTDDGGARGRAGPGHRLTARDVRFGGGRSGPADPWDVDPKTRLELERRYRELAQRELDLGRPRRAAYILATLLGDLRGAAAALDRGGAAREAAALYVERLDDRAAAAACLERHGLLTDALDLYRAIPDLPHVADLLTRLGRDDEARALHREIVAADLAQGRYVAAAARLEAALGAPDEALDALEAGWESAERDACAAAWFALAARLGRATRVGDWIRARLAGAPTGDEAVAFVRAIAAHGVRFPDPVVARLATDAVRVTVARQLGGAVPRARGELLRALCATDPDDRLLARDVGRVERRLPRSVAPPVRSAGLTALGCIDLPFGVDATTAFRSTPEALWILHYDVARRGLRLARQRWRDGVVELATTWDAVPRAPYALRIDWGRGIDVFSTWGGARVERRSVGASLRELELGTPAHWPEISLAVCDGELPSSCWILEGAATDSIVLTCVTSEGARLMTSPPLPIDSPAELACRAIVEIGNLVLVATAARLLRYEFGGEVDVLDADLVPRTALLRSAAHTLDRVVAVRADGGCELWTSLGDERPACDRFAMDIEDPLVLFTPGLGIVVASERGVAVYRTQGSCAHRALRASWDLPAAPLALVSTARVDEVGVVTSDAILRRFRIG